MERSQPEPEGSVCSSSQVSESCARKGQEGGSRISSERMGPSPVSVCISSRNCPTSQSGFPRTPHMLCCHRPVGAPRPDLCLLLPWLRLQGAGLRTPGLGVWAESNIHPQPHPPEMGTTRAGEKPFPWVSSFLGIFPPRGSWDWDFPGDPAVPQPPCRKPPQPHLSLQPAPQTARLQGAHRALEAPEQGRPREPLSVLSQSWHPQSLARPLPAGIVRHCG